MQYELGVSQNIISSTDEVVRYRKKVEMKTCKRTALIQMMDEKRQGGYHTSAYTAGAGYSLLLFLFHHRFIVG